MHALARNGALRTIALALGATMLVAGCTSGSSGGEAADGESAAPSTAERTDSSEEESSPPEPGEFGSEECSLTQRQLNVVVRDWTRLDVTVGREDHRQYTQQLLDRLERLAPTAEECNGADDFEAFVDVIATIDERSSAAPDFDSYAEAAETGNAWLEEAGLGPNALLRG